MPSRGLYHPYHPLQATLYRNLKNPLIPGCVRLLQSTVPLCFLFRSRPSLSEMIFCHQKHCIAGHSEGFSDTHCLKQSFHYILKKRTVSIPMYASNIRTCLAGYVFFVIYFDPRDMKKSPCGLSCHVPSHHSPCRTYSVASQLTCDRQIGSTDGTK